MKFSLVKGEIEEFAILDDRLPDNLEDLMVDCSIRAKLNVQSKSIGIVNIIKYSINDKILLKITSVIYFQIEDNSWKELVTDDKIIFSKEKLHHLGIIVTGATRGMLIAKCANTPFSALILPPINVSKLLNEDIVFDNPTV